MTKLAASMPDPTVFARRGDTVLGLGEPYNLGSYTEVSPYLTGTVGVILVYGQSNCANFVDSTYSVTNPTHSFQLDPFSGKLFIMREPVMGCNGGLGYSSGTVTGNWTARLGDSLIAAGWRNNVVICNVAAGGTSSAQWIPSGDCYNRLIAGCHRCLNFRYPITLILRHQGESDFTGSFSAATVTANLLAERAAIDAQGITALTIVCQVSASGQSSNNTRTGHTNAISASPTTLKAGPDSDAIGNRYDGTHFNSTGAASMTSAAVTSIMSLVP